MSLKINIEQKQRFQLNPSLRQYLDLLALPLPDLYGLVQRELQENPVLRETEGQDTDNYRQAGFEERGAPPLEMIVQEKASLKEHLLEQARLSPVDRETLDAMERVIFSLDDSGFLVTNTDEEGEPWKGAVSQVQLLDPPGCATVNVQESLLVQAGYRYPDEKLLEYILRECFEDYENLRYAKLARLTGEPEEEILRVLNLSRNLSPRPGNAFPGERIGAIMPDLEVVFQGERPLVITRDEWLPRLTIDRHYEQFVRKKTIEKKQRDYIQEKLQSARILIGNIRQRRETLRQVVEVIVDIQKDYLIHGPGYMKPLTYREIAEVTGFHVSTIGRVTAGKYIQTGRGILKLGDFFVSRLTRDETTSSESVKKALVDLIQEEPAERPYRDGEIVRMLAEAGINVARRTVARYREVLEIPSFSIRKKIYRMNGSF
jgi:RNA polymerase sigma-54 factor